MTQATDDNHSEYDDSNQYNDESSFAFLSRFGDNDPDDSPAFPPHNGAPTRASISIHDGRYGRDLDG
jgi:hypothetical protein